MGINQMKPVLTLPKPKQKAPPPKQVDWEKIAPALIGIGWFTGLIPLAVICVVWFAFQVLYYAALGYMIIGAVLGIASVFMVMGIIIYEHLNDRRG
jgi:hypothetical protein